MPTSTPSSNRSARFRTTTDGASARVRWVPSRVLMSLLAALRRPLAGADGRGWLRWHLHFMVGSMPFLVVAGLNQTLPAVGVAYSTLLLAATTVVAVAVTGRVSRALLRRHGRAWMLPA